MFVFNVSLKKNKIQKFLITFLVLVVIIALFFLVCSLKNKSKAIYVKDDITQDIAALSPDNYTNVLKNSYEDINTYLNKKIKFSGFVYRLYDFKDTQFVLGREMVLSRISDTQAKVVVVGFLCNTDEAKNFEDGTWVEIEGTIQKGFYHTEIPIVEVTSIKKTSVPENPYVCPPSNSYVKSEII